MKNIKTKVTRRRFINLLCAPLLAWGVLAVSVSLLAADATIANTLPATSITGNSATLQGSVDSVEGVIEKGFEYGTSPGYGSTIQDTSGFGYRFDRDLDPCCNKNGQLQGATSIGVSGEGDVYIADNGNKRIQKFDIDGNYILQWGGPGEAAGQFRIIRNITVDVHGNVYTAEDNGRIQKFDQNGNYLLQWQADHTGYASATGDIYITSDSQANIYVAFNVSNDTENPFDPYIKKFDQNGTLLLQFGEYGYDPGQFSAHIGGILVDDQDSLYVWSTGLNKFDSNGSFLQTIYINSGQLVWWGGHFYGIQSESNSYRIQKFDQNGTLLETVAEDIKQPGFVWAFTIDTDGNFYIVFHDITVKYSSDGVFLTEWGWVGDGEGDEAFRQAASMTYGTDGDLFIADGRKIKRYNSLGQYMLQWDINSNHSERVIGSDAENNIYTLSLVSGGQIRVFDSGGNQIDSWAIPGGPSSLAVGPEGNVYATFTGDNVVKKFDSSGTQILQWGEAGSGNGQFDWPGGVAVAPNGDIYVADSGNNRIQKFDQNGNYITQWGSQGPGSGQFDWPRAIAVDNEGNVFVSDYTMSRIQKFDQNGNFTTLVRRDAGTEYFGDILEIVIDNQSGDIYARSSSSGYGWRTKIYQYGAFAAELEDLNCNTTYYYRAYAVTTEGTLYGDQETFQTTGCGMFVSITSPGDDAELELGLNTVTGTGPSNEELEIVLNGDVIGTTATGNDGNWTYDLTLSSTGDYTLDARWAPSGDIAFIPYLDMDTMAGAIQVINTQTQENIINVPLSPELGAPISATLNHAKTKLYVATIAAFSGPGKLLEIDLSTMEIRSVDTAGQHAFQVAVLSDDTAAYVLSLADGDEGTIYVQQYDLAEMSVTGDPILELGATSFNDGIPFPRIALNTTGSKLYVLGIRYNPPLVIDTATAVVTPLDWEIDPEYSAADFIIRGDTGYVAPFSMEDCQIRVIDLISDTVTQVITMPACENTDVITKLAVSDTQDFLYAIGLIGLYKLDLQAATSSQLTSWPEKFTFGAGLTSDGAQLYLPAAMGGGLSVWDTQANEWIDDGSGGLLPLDAVAYSFGDRFIGTIAPVSDQISFSVADNDDPNTFITTWKTDNPGSSNDNQITIPTTGTGYNYTVEWEEVGNPGNNGTAGAFNDGNTPHTITFPSAGTYKVSITGDFPGLCFAAESYMCDGGNGGDREKILTVEQWGTNSWASLRGAFAGATNIQIPALDAPDLLNITHLDWMFAEATSFNSDINHWDVAGVTDTGYMFRDASSFNQPLDDWDVGNVTSMYAMFQRASTFNQPLNSWDTGQVENMSYVFHAASAFNQPLDEWDTSSVTDTSFMFSLAVAFDQDINGWDVSSVTDMASMFYFATSFNQPLNNWDVSSVVNMESMFGKAPNFNQSLAGWDVSSVTDMSQMLVEATSFSADNYDETFIAWAELTLQEDVPFATDATYCQGAAARASIINTYNWSITDGGEDPECVPDDSDAFITTWKTDNPGESNDNQIIIPTHPDENYNYTVDWEEVGNPDNNGTAGPFTGTATITFPSAGTYKVSITGDFPSIYFNNSGDREKIMTVEQWGANQWTSMSRAFYGASNLQIPATDAPDLSGVGSTGYMFADATNFNSDIGHWDVSSVTDMSAMFSSAISFNQPLSDWDVSSVVSMNQMFAAATSFNQPIGDWDTSALGDLYATFMYATSFNQPLNNWDVSNVELAYYTFMGATSFNQPLDTWDTSSIEYMTMMFLGASSFDQSLESWDVSNVADISMMFGSMDFLIEANMEGIPYEDWPQEIKDLYGLPASGLSTAHYDATLIAWSALTLQDDVTFDAGTSTYCDAANQRQSIIDTFGWTINDSGENCDDEEEPTDPETPGGPNPPTRPTTPPSTVTPDEPPVAPGEGEQPGVAEEQAPEDDGEAAVVRDEDGLESEPGGGSTTPRRPGGEAVQGRENFVARTLDGVASFFGVSPITVAQAFPWLLIILLLLLALVTAIKVIQQLFVIAKTRKLVARQALLNHEKKSLISLATHYLRTPLTILSSGIEMLPAESTARQTISKATAGLKTTIDELIGQIETNKNLVNLAEPSKPLHRRTSLLQPAIFVPTLLTLGLVLGANILIAVATAFDPGWQHVGIQILGVLIVGGLFYIAYDHHRQKKTLQAYEQQLLKYEEGLDVARNQFVKGMADTLVPAVVAVDTAVPAGLPEDTTKFLKEGLRQLEHTVGDFILIGQLEKQVLQQRATSVAVRDTISRAQQQLEQSDAQLSVNVPADTTVHQPQFLLHKVFGSLIDNAVAHNKPNTPAEVTSKQGKAITAIEVTDYGEGIPEDKLSLLFKPLSRVQTAEDFTHQGIGLSLYVSRLIMHYLGGDISAASKVGKGTTMQVKVPNQMEV